MRAILNQFLSCGDFRLKPQDIAVLHPDVGKTLFIQKLFARRFVMKFIAQDLAVGSVLGKTHLIQQHGEDAVHGLALGKPSIPCAASFFIASLIGT